MVVSRRHRSLHYLVDAFRRSRTDIMSQSKFDFDQLLSDHLDGWLEGDDAKAFERALENDPGLRTRLDAMTADQSALRQLFTQDRSAVKSLPSDFAADIARQALQRRRSEMDVVPAVLNEPFRSSNRRLRLVSAVVATAAAALLITSLSRGPGPGSEPVQNQSQSVVGLSSGLLQSSVGGDSSIDNETRPPTVNEIAKSIEASRPIAVVDDVSNRGPILMASSTPGTSDRVASTTPASDALNASGVMRPLDSSATVSIGSDSGDALSIAGAVLVYDVRLTVQGRITGSVSAAMNQIGMAETSRQPIDGELVQAAKSVDAFSDKAKFQILYLRAPAKQLDRLFETLLRDGDNVDSIALSLVTDSPILKVTDQFERVDSTLIRQPTAAASYVLSDDDGQELDVLRRLLDDQTFIPVTPDVRGSSEVAPSGSGRDVMSRVLVIIR